MTPEIIFSFLLPTRDRINDLKALLESIQATTAHPEYLEIILGVDEDDEATLKFEWNGLNVKKTILPCGLTMGAMNQACYKASSGRYVMLMNDDMLLRTQGWDKEIMRVLAPIRDDIFLAHVNDLLFGEKLCCFPMVSRTFCDIAGGICPEFYERYRIDDHVYNVFNLLALAGHRRIYYFPDVVFEHLNFEGQGIENREYIFNKVILERDACRFDDHLDNRKALAQKLADHIEQKKAEEVRAARAEVFSSINDSTSCRRPEHVRKIITGNSQRAAGTRVTIGVVCSDMRRAHTQTCLNLIKAHTSNYELVILDNANDPNFNHAREMNRLLEFSRNDQVVLLDDDVFVEPGWLEDMQAALTGNVGCVTPLHKDGNGKLSYAGIYVGLNEGGDHAHLMEMSDRPFAVPTICSAVMLIDMKRCGHLRFDEGCLKYFHDLDYGFQVWESGSAVVCNPGVPVTHLGGATLKQGSTAAQSFISRDREIFVQRWLKSGGLTKLRTECWNQVPEIDRLYAIAEDFAKLLKPEQLVAPGWKERATQYIDQLKLAPALRSTFLMELRNAMFGEDKPTRDLEIVTSHLRWLRNVLQSGQEHAGEMAAMRPKIASLVERWNAENRRIVVYPAGAHTADLFRTTSLLNANIVGLGDSNRLLEGDELWGRIIVSPATLMHFEPDVVLISSKNFENEIAKMLAPLLPEEVELVRLYAES